MRFKGRFEAWRIVMGVAVIAIVLLLLGSDIGRAVRGESDASRLGFVVVALGVAALVSVELLRSQPLVRNYVDLFDREFLVVRGREAHRIPYDSVTEVRIRCDRLVLRGIPTTMQHVLVKYDGQNLYVSVEDESGLVAELRRRCPQVL